MEVLAPAFAHSRGWKRIARVVRSRRFDYTVDGLLVLAGVLLVLEEEFQLRALDDGRPEDFDARPDSPWNIIELTLSALFLLELLVKLAALGFFRCARPTQEHAQSSTMRPTQEHTLPSATRALLSLARVPRPFGQTCPMLACLAHPCAHGHMHAWICGGWWVGGRLPLPQECL